MKRVLLLLLLSFTAYLCAEIRAVWILPWDIATPASIDEVIQTALDNNQNELLVEVRYRSDALFDTSKGAYLYPNPEPQSHVLKSTDFDPLSYVLEKAHAHNLNVQAWVIVFNATPLDKGLIQQNYIYQNHKDWLTADRSGSKLNGTKQYGYFIDPGIPEAQDYLLNVIGNLAAGYPELDGIHLDYIRYPEANLGYHPVSVARYDEYCRNQEEISFNDWRMLQVSNFVEKTYHRIKEINPQMLLSAAVFADLSEATNAYAQDWPNWLKTGIIDRIYPMAYNQRFSNHAKQVERIKLLGYNQNIVLGIRAWDDYNRPLVPITAGRYTVADIAKRITQARELDFAGVAMFSMAGLKIGNAWPQLTRISFSDYVPFPQKVPFKVAEPVTEPSKADITFFRDASEFVISLSLPFAGSWHWELYADTLLYKQSRNYQKGQNFDWWDGMLDQGRSELEPGHYIVHLYAEEASYKYLIPIEVKASR